VQDADSLRPEDWSSGDRLWALGFIAPFGDARRIAKNLKHNVFPNDVGRFLRVKKNTDTMRTINVHGVNVLRKNLDAR
jgi:cytolysin-activating lysine-acyltransferase